MLFALPSRTNLHLLGSSRTSWCPASLACFHTHIGIAFVSEHVVLILFDHYTPMILQDDLMKVSQNGSLRDHFISK